MKRQKYDIQTIRSITQTAIAFFNLYIGWRFYLFVRYFETQGATAFVPRPPSVEAYLPISALLSFKYFLSTGIFDRIHPAGLSLFIIILFTSWLLKRGFCSWICPIGTISEWAWKLGENIFGRNIRLPRFLDYPLRSLKYLLLLFFLYAAMSMNALVLKLFLNGPYNRVADIKMLKFFTEISSTALTVILLLVIFSILSKNFWCRYLCPYGALLGILAWASPIKVTRNKEKCINCDKCTRACPSYLEVARSKRVHSVECTACLACISACPVSDALQLEPPLRSRPITNRLYAALLIGLFFSLIGLAQVTGHWQTSISLSEYQKRILEIESPIYTHPSI